MFSSQVTDVESSAESKNVFRFRFQGGSPSITTGTAPGPFLHVLKISILAILTTSHSSNLQIFVEIKNLEIFKAQCDHDRL